MNAVIYELYVDKFAGDFSGLTSKLDYLERLGVTCVHILPHYPSPMIDGGYDVSDYKNVRKELGTLDDFREFADRAHARGIKIILDLVLNHVSSEHPWFKEARSAFNNSKRDFFLWSKTGKEFSDFPNMLPDVKTSNWIINPPTKDFYYATFYPEQPDLNWQNPKVFDEICSVIDFWSELGADGFRIDAAPFLIKGEDRASSFKKTHNIIKKLRAHAQKKNLEVVFLAEADLPAKDAKKYFGSGDECQLVYNFPLMQAMYLSLMKGELKIEKEEILKTFSIPANTQWATFLRNHDEISLSLLDRKNREVLIKWFDPEFRYLFSTGTSMRLASIMRGNKEKILEAFRLLFSLPGSPIIYYGDEIGLENIVLKKRAVDTRLAVRGVFDWSRTEEQETDPESLLNGVRRIIALHHSVEVNISKISTSEDFGGNL